MTRYYVFIIFLTTKDLRLNLTSSSYLLLSVLIFLVDESLGPTVTVYSYRMSFPPYTLVVTTLVYTKGFVQGSYNDYGFLRRVFHTSPHFSEETVP